MSKVTVRPYDEENDVAMLISTWRNALWFDMEDRDDANNHKFFRDTTRAIKAIINDPDTKIRVACLTDDHNLILGVSVINKYNLTWIYVKADYRGKGIGTLLAKGAATVSEPSTRIAKAIVKKKDLKVQNVKIDLR